MKDTTMIEPRATKIKRRAAIILDAAHMRLQEIGELSDAEYRVWVGCLCLHAQGTPISPVTIRMQVFMYKDVSLEETGRLLQDLVRCGLIECVDNAYRIKVEDRQEERKREDRRRESDHAGVSPDLSPEELVQLYNDMAPDECPAVLVLSEERRRKAERYLRAFPRREFWEQVFQQMRSSQFLRGKGNQDRNRRAFVADFDWLLSRGRDGTENVVKVHDGRYS